MTTIEATAAGMNLAALALAFRAGQLRVWSRRKRDGAEQAMVMLLLIAAGLAILSLGVVA